MSKSCPIDSDFVVRISSAPSKGSYSSYVRVGVLEVDPGVTRVPGISTRYSGVRSVVYCSGRVHDGKRVSSESVGYIEHAKQLAAELNRSQASRRKRAATIAAKRAAREALEAAPALDALALAT